MPSWYEVFDNVEVQYATRRQAATLGAVLAGMLAVTVALVLYASALHLPSSGVALAVMALWGATAVWCLRRLRALHRVVWCIKLSDREIVGYDYARRKVRIDWIEAERVILNTDGLLVVGPAPHCLEIRHLFPDFAELSHRIVSYAEFYEIPVCIDGQPWQQLDVYDLFPFLAEDSSEDPSSDPPATAHGSS